MNDGRIYEEYFYTVNGILLRRNRKKGYVLYHYVLK